MRLLISLAFASLTALILMACNSADSPNRVASSSTPATPAKPKAAPPAGVPADGVRRITTVELKDLISKGQAYVVDVRNDASYKSGHVRGAKLIPNTQIAERSKELPRDKTIVTYCSWPNEHTSAGAVLDLRKKGIENAVALLGGLDAWKNAGLPVDKGE